MLKKFVAALNISKFQISDFLFMCASRTKPTYFTKESKLDFTTLMSFMLNLVRKTLQVELDNYFEVYKGADVTITKQAFSKAREKISPDAFVQLSNAIISGIYTDGEYNKYKGYRLSAIDGTVLELHNSPEIREAFNYVENQFTQLARAQASCIYDIENDIVLTSTIAKYGTSERALAIELIKRLKALGEHQELILFDRGYPSKELISFLETSSIKFLMRVSKSFIKIVNEAKAPDQTIEVKIENKTYKLRVVKFILPSGEEEILLTNLLDHVEFSTEDLKVLYFKRWGIETYYDIVKNRLQIENFTGKTVISIVQDFYASIYLSNMAALAKADAQEELKIQNQGKELKYEQQVNMNVLIGKFKNKFISILLEENPSKSSILIEKLLMELKRNVIPIRPNRSFPRNFKARSNKYFMHQKSGL